MTENPHPDEPEYHGDELNEEGQPLELPEPDDDEGDDISPQEE